LDNYFINSFSEVGFVDMAKGDYRLSSSSQYRNAGTDGKDIGYQPGSSSDTTYKAGDVFRVAVEKGVVKYYKNNVLVYQSSVAVTYPLVAAASILDMAGTVSNGAAWPATP
jgi:hypothetical protein